MSNELQYEIHLNNWIEHTDGRLPHLGEDTEVVIERRDGMLITNPKPISGFRWDISAPHSGYYASDIIRYRITKL